MAYTTIDKPTDYFETKLYSGNGSITSSDTNETVTSNVIITNASDSASYVTGETIHVNGGMYMS